jgi:hypothetical protein
MRLRIEPAVIGDIQVIVFTGKLDFGKGTKAVKNCIYDAARSGFKKIALNFTDVTKIAVEILAVVDFYQKLHPEIRIGIVKPRRKKVLGSMAMAKMIMSYISAGTLQDVLAQMKS